MTNGVDGDKSREEHERFIDDLAAMQGDEPRHLETHLDAADMSYSTAHSAGIVDKNFVWPSVQRERLYKEETYRDRPPTIVERTISPASMPSESASEQYRKDFEELTKLTTPEEGMQGSEFVAGIMEHVDDRSWHDPSTTVTWLGCNSLEEAREYCERAGWAHEEPGPGEGDGVYTMREVHANPHLAQ